MKEEKKPNRRRAKRKRVEKEYCTFIIEVVDWEVSYLFTMADGKDPSKPYKDYLHLDVKGVIRSPKSFREKR